MKLIHIHPRDNVAVALEDISAGEALQVDGSSVTAAGDVKRGHKLALVPIPAGGVLVLGLGCENLTMEQFKAELGEWDEDRVKFLICQDEAVFDKAVRMIEDFKGYFTSHGQVVYENPSPGNKAGGITTLEDKSCGCVQKGGSAQITDVLGYGEQVTRKGLNLLSGPGNDLVSATALTAAGAHMILFTTGRGTPFGAPAPTVKISTNTPLFEKKGSWIDFNTGTVAQGESLDAAGGRLLDFVLEAASGKKTRAEERGFREISIFKDGVVL